MTDSSLGPKNPQVAIECFIASAEKGHIGSAAQLGRIYAEGIAVYQSTKQALLWYQLAADAGHQA